MAQAVDRLPEEFRQKLDNVEVVVEDWPDAETLRLAGMRSRAALLGFYHGIPQTKRTHNYGLILPDKISIYQRPIEMRCHTMAQVQAIVERVLRHEIAHQRGVAADGLPQQFHQPHLMSLADRVSPTATENSDNNPARMHPVRRANRSAR